VFKFVKLNVCISKFCAMKFSTRESVFFLDNVKTQNLSDKRNDDTCQNNYHIHLPQ